jgi:hypothetical protein
LDHLLLARSSLSSLCAIQAIATVAIDFNRTHATNPLWTGHARFHVVWQSSTVVFLSALELVLVWWPGPYADHRFYLAALLAAASPMGFLAAFASRRLFGGTLSDPNGIPLARLHLFGRVRFIDMNLVAVIGALVSLTAMIAIYRS